MAYGEKYRIDFKSLDGYDCRVQFWYDGYSGSITNLDGGPRPFVLKEFNTDEDLFKPIRPQLAEMEILASSSGVSIDDFLSDNDTDIYVTFAYNNVSVGYWRGYLLQDDFQEVWQDTNHIIMLRATEGLGYMKNFPISNAGAEITAKTTPLDFLQYATNPTVQGWTKYTIFSNLFHDSMTDLLTYTGIDQCKIDPKTWQIQSTEYQDAYKVTEDINRAFNQTLFMYNDVWHVLRMEELYVPKSENLRGFTSNLGTRTALQKRYDISVGVNQEVKPISPEMLRFIKRRTKIDRVKFKYEQISEILPNGTFSRGTLTGSGPTYKEYSLTNWTSSTSLVRKEVYTGTGGRLTDNYVLMPTLAASYNILYSESVKVFAGDKLDFAINFKYVTNVTSSFNLLLAFIKLTGASANYYLNENGQWSTTSTNIYVPANGSGGVDLTVWNAFNVTTDPIPDNGSIEVWLYSDFQAHLAGNGQVQFKGLQFNIIETFNGDTATNIEGIDSLYTKSADVKVTSENDVYLQDGFSYNYKGTIYESNGTTITDADWYRYRYPAETFSFRRQNLTAYWENNRFNRNKIDANFYGLTFNSGDRIGLINTIIFEDDDPDKIYAILNLKEIDFASGTWSATLLEVWDDNKDANVIENKTFDADVTSGTYNSPQYVPWTAVTLADFTITGGNLITYTGSASVSVPIVVSLSGNINTTTTTPVTTTFRVLQNGSPIKTQTYPVFTNPQAFTFNLSPTGNITINPGDTFQVDVSNNITQIQYTSGAFTINYTAPGSITYDTFSEEYIYNK